MKRRPHRLGVIAVQGRSVMSASPVSSETCVDQSPPPPQCHSPLQLLNDDQCDLISLLVAYQDKYDLPTEDDVRKVSV